MGCPADISSPVEMYDLYMSETDTLEVGERAGRTVDARYLYQIINTVSSSLDLDRVLRAIVDLVSEAIDCHACFVYFVEPDDGSLVLRAVSDPYGDLAGRLRFERGEGLAGWVAEHDQPLFITDNALADPRIKIVPEAEEEKYQSFCAAPLRLKSGHVIGVIALHAEAPREFGRADSDFLVHAASLVAGAIENARLYEDTRRRLALVEGLADLARAVSAAPGEDALLPAVAKRAHRLLGAEQCDVLVLEDGGRLRLGAAWPLREDASRPLDANELGLELAKSARRGGDAGRRLASILWGDEAAGTPMVVPMVVTDDLVGFLALRMPEHRAASEAREIASSVAGQTAVAIRRVHLIDRLTERNAIKDLFEDLSHGGGSAPDLAERARALGCDLDQPHVVLQAATRAGTVAGALGGRRRILRDRRHPGVPRLAVRPARRRASRAGAAARRRRAGGAREAAGDPRVAWPTGTRWRSACPTRARARRRSPPASRRPTTPSPRRRWSAPTPASSASTTWAPTSTCCASRRTDASATAAARRCSGWPSTTAATRPSCCSRWRSTCAGGATSRPPRRPCTCTRTRCASGSAASRT